MDLEKTYPVAKELAKGVTLLTKDGRKIGNAIVISESPVDYFWVIQTDFGGIVRLSEKEIFNQFYLGFAANLAEWTSRHITQILKKNGYPHIADTKNRDLAEIEFAKVANEKIAEDQIRAKLNQARKEKAKTKNPLSKNKKIKKPAAPTDKNTNIFDTVFSKRKVA